MADEDRSQLQQCGWDFVLPNVSPFYQFCHYNIFVKAVIRSRSIPFAIRGAKTAQPSALDLFMQQRRAAEASKEPEMTLDEINAEIRAAREERRKKQQMV